MRSGLGERRNRHEEIKIESYITVKRTVFPTKSLVVYRLVHAPVTRESGVRLPARENFFLFLHTSAVHPFGREASLDPLNTQFVTVLITLNDSR